MNMKMKCGNIMCLICENYRSFENCDGCLDENAVPSNEKAYKNFKFKSCHMRSSCPHYDCKFSKGNDKSKMDESIESYFEYNLENLKRLAAMAAKLEEKIIRFKIITGLSIEDFERLFLGGHVSIKYETWTKVPNLDKKPYNPTPGGCIL